MTLRMCLRMSSLRMTLRKTRKEEETAQVGTDPKKKLGIQHTCKYREKKAIPGGYPPETKRLLPGLSGVMVGQRIE